MWNRKAIKQAAKKRMSANYWKMVLVGLILAFLTGGVGFNYSFGQNSYSNVFGEEEESVEQDFEEAFEDGFEFSIPGNGHHNELDPFFGKGESMAPFGMFMGIFAVVMVVVLAISIPLAIFVFNPLVLGAKRFFYVNIKREADLKEVGNGFDKSYLNRVKNLFLVDLFTFLWSLLFVIPGIIKAYEYRMIPYLLAEYPDMSREEVFATSKKMMTGNKWKAFVFDLSYFGWFLLSGITCGIVGIFYVNPYYYQGDAMLYDAIKYDCGMNGTTAQAQDVVEDIFVAEDVTVEDTDDTI
ncbi:MAG: DUF975 family protein [Lachnospiraceae bacterium]|nr:DUF975 family protein [Lachnospiraceae bacterium]